MVWMWALSSAALAGPADTALEHVAAADDGAAPGVTWEVARVVPWAGGTHVHLEQRWQGLRVERQRRVVSLGVDGRVRRSLGASAAHVALSTTPTIAESDAVDAARNWVRGFVGPGDLWEPRTDLVVWLDSQDVPHLAWGIDLSVAVPMSTWRLWVDAHDGRVLAHAKTSLEARGNIYPSSPAESTLTEVELQRLESPLGLDGQYAFAWSCDNYSFLFGCSAKSSHALPDGQGDYLFADDPLSFDDPLAEVQMYHHLDLVSEWFDIRFGFRLAEPIEGLVNFEMDNAFFGDADGDGVEEVAFGQGAAIDFSYDADVIYHEFGHAVIGTVATLGFFGADSYGIDFSPLSLNEGSADLFSMMITEDPALGVYAGQGFGLGAIRDLDDDRRCPHDLYGEGHEDGMIWGAVGWNLAEDPAVGPEVTAQLAYGAATSWAGEITWAEAGDSLVAAADDLLAAGEIDAAVHTAAMGHIDAGGLPGCERVIPLDAGDTSRQLAFATGLADQVGGHVPLSAQYSLEAPADAEALVFEVVSAVSTGGPIPWTAFVRRGDFVEHEVQDIFGFPVPVPSAYDFAVDGDGAGEVVIALDSDPALEPGATYHVAFATRGSGLGAFDLLVGDIVVEGRVTLGAAGTTPGTGGTTTPEGIDPSTGTDGGDAVADADDVEASGGCGCASGGPVGLGWLVLPVVVFGMRRR